MAAGTFAHRLDILTALRDLRTVCSIVLSPKSVFGCSKVTAAVLPQKRCFKVDVNVDELFLAAGRPQKKNIQSSHNVDELLFGSRPSAEKKLTSMLYGGIFAQIF